MQKNISKNNTLFFPCSRILPEVDFSIMSDVIYRMSSERLEELLHSAQNLCWSPKASKIAYKNI